MVAGAPTLRVLIASDDLLLIHRLRHALEADGRSSVVGATTSTDELGTLAAELLPDIAFIDQSLSESGSLDAIEAIDTASTARAIVLLGGSGDIEWDSLSAARITAVVSRDRPPTEIAAVVCEIAALSIAFERALESARG